MSRESCREYYRANREKWAEYYRRKLARRPLYNIWHGMLVRTGVRPGAKAREVKDYIGRGIKVCEGWKDYANFEAWALAHGWKRELEIDRINVDGNYEPSNCRFVSRSRNQRNKRCTVLVTYNGIRMPLADVHRATGCTLDYRLVLRRVSRDNWPVEKAITTPVD